MLKKVLLGQASRLEKEALSYLASENKEWEILCREIASNRKMDMDAEEIELAWSRHRVRMKTENGRW